MKLASAAVAGFTAVLAASGCTRTPGVEPMGPVITIAPDDFVLRDVRKDAARRLNCQVPDVTTALDAWAGSEGNVIAYGCGFQFSYYLRCSTSHQCSISPTG